MVELLKSSLGEPCGGTAGCFFFLLRVGLVDSANMGFSGAVAPLEVAFLHLLDFLGVTAGNLIIVWCGATGLGSAETEPLTVVSAMMSSMLFFSVAIQVTLVASTSNYSLISSRSSPDLSSSITFSFPLLEKSRTGGLAFYSSSDSSLSSLIMCFCLRLGGTI